MPTTTFTYNTEDRGTNVYPNGSWNRMTEVNNGQGGRVVIQYDNIGAIEQPNMGDYARVFDNNRRVHYKTLYDGRGNSYQWGYEYVHPAYNWASNDVSAPPPGEQTNSAALYYTNYVDPGHRSLLAHKSRTEFRGHLAVREIGPDGSQTKHEFYQGNVPCGEPGNVTNTCFSELRAREFLKGREYLMVAYEPNGSTAVSEVSHQFGVVNVDHMGYDARGGLYHAFVHETQAVEITRANDQNGSPISRSKTTQYTFDDSASGYGNLTEVRELVNGGLLRRTLYNYATRNDLPNGTYIVDRRSSEAIYDTANNYMALTFYTYDNNSTSLGVMGQKGQLTGVRKFYNIPANTTNLYNVNLRSNDSSYGYDVYGNQQSATTFDDYGTALFNGSSWTLSALGRNIGPRTTTTTYDGVLHSLPERVDPPTVNGVTLTEQATYDKRMGTLTSVTGPNGSATTVYAEYDKFGRLVKIIKPGDSSSVPTIWAEYYDWEQPFTYMVGRREVSGSGSDWRPTFSFYDGLGRMIQTKSESQNGTQNIATEKQYDGYGRVIRESQPHYIPSTQAGGFFGYQPPVGGERWTTTTYDVLGRPTNVQAPDNTNTGMSYFIPTDGMGLATKVTDARGNKTYSEYDTAGRLLRVKENIGGNNWFTHPTTSYQYNALDLLTRVTDAQGNITNIKYDSLGRKYEMSEPNMGTWYYEYDVNGNLKKQTDAKTQQTTFSYDALGRLTGKYHPTGGESAEYRYDETFSPNGKGQRTSMRSDGSTFITSWHYDARGRTSRADYDIIGRPQRTYIWEYDAADRVTRIQYPTTENVYYNYDAAWRQYSASLTFGGASETLVGSASYSALDQPQDWWFGNGLHQTWQYNNVMARLNNTNVTNAFNVSYEYDAVGNLSRYLNNISNENQQFGYDQRDRLTTWTSNWQGGFTQNFGYDLIGNLTNKAGVGYSYGSGGNGTGAGPHQARTIGGQSYSYDANGNMQSGGGRNYTWNADNQPIGITYNGGSVEGYRYDAEGERVQRTATNGVSTFYIGGMTEVDEYNGSAAGRRTYYTFGGKVIAQRADPVGSRGQLTYIHGDQLGSNSVTTNQNGGTTSWAEYDPWGAVRRDSQQQQTSTVNYTGQKKDDTGLLYYHARYYDPNIARFTSADSIVPDTAGAGGGKPNLTVDFHETGFVSGLNGLNATTINKGFSFQLSNRDRQAVDPNGAINPQALNRYSYVQNNPLRYTDPTGHMSAEDIARHAQNIAKQMSTLTDDLLRMAKKGDPTARAQVRAAILSLLASADALFAAYAGLSGELKSQAWTLIQTALGAAVDTWYYLETGLHAATGYVRNMVDQILNDKFAGDVLHRLYTAVYDDGLNGLDEKMTHIHNDVCKLLAHGVGCWINSDIGNPSNDSIPGVPRPGDSPPPAGQPR